MALHMRLNNLPASPTSNNNEELGDFDVISDYNNEESMVPTESYSYEDVILELINDDTKIKKTIGLTAQLIQHLEKYITNVATNKRNNAYQMKELEDDCKKMKAELHNKRQEILHLTNKNEELEQQKATIEERLEMFEHKESKSNELKTKYTHELEKSQSLFNENENLKEKIQDLETSNNAKIEEMRTMERNMAKEHMKFEKIKIDLLNRLANKDKN